MCIVFKQVFSNIENKKLSALLHSATKIEDENVDREDKNIDLTIPFDNGTILFLENKTKSIANINQLNQYSEKLHDKNTLFLLISLTNTRISAEHWTSITYRTFIRIVESRFKENSIIEPELLVQTYNSFLISDYIQYVYNLIEIVDTIFIEKGFLGKSLGDFKNEIRVFKKVRFDDVLFKLLFELIRYHVVRELKNTNKYLILEEQSSNHEIIDAKLPVKVTVGMSRSTPLIDIRLLKDSFPSVRVQLQNNTLKLMVNLESDRNWKSEVEQIDSDGCLFEFHKYLDFLKKRNEKEKKYGEYYSYNNKMSFDIYKCRDIKSDTKMSTVIDILLEYSQKLIDSYSI